MRKEIIETGKSVEEAINAACQKLGCEREDCEWEIVDLPKKGFLGLKNIPAKVKVFVEVPEEEKPAPKPAPRPAPVQREQRPPREQRPAPPQRPASPPRAEAPAPQAEAKPAKPARSEINYSETPPSEEVREKAAVSAAYLSGVLAQMGLTAQVEPVWEESGVCLSVQGEGLGAIIGRRGETLDALQYLSGLVANRLEGDYLRVTVDCGDYRVKRRATLEALAHKVAGQVLKTDISKTLEPMNPFERRIIHATVSTIEGVSSTSIGEEPNRRVVITTPTAKSPRRGSRDFSRGSRDSGGRDRDRRSGRDFSRSPRSEGGRDFSRGPRPEGGRDRDRDRRGDRPGRDSRDNRVGRERPAAYQPSKEPDVQPTEAANQPLYGKIDLE